MGGYKVYCQIWSEVADALILRYKLVEDILGRFLR
jgi:hypothetical protein